MTVWRNGALYTCAGTIISLAAPTRTAPVFSGRSGFVTSTTLIEEFVWLPFVRSETM